MPRHACKHAGSPGPSLDPATSVGRHDPPPLAQDSEPRDWSELGRRVLAEALRRATDELVQRNGSMPTSVVPSLPAEGLS